MNIIEYAKTKRETFDQSPFNEVDSLIFAKLAYIHFEGLVPSIDSSLRKPKPVLFVDLLKNENFEKMFHRVGNKKETTALFYEVAMSSRYRNVGVIFAEEIFDKDAAKQFAAVTFIIKKKLAYIAYRGTDNTIVGWKENLDMSYKFPVPAQDESLLYLERVAKRLKKHKLIIGGHSKGGNLSQYAAMVAPERIQKRIISIYNHDGPGFKEEYFINTYFPRIKDKINKSVPESTVVGMLLHYPGPYKIIASNEFGVLQHDPFTWLIKGDAFIKLDSLSKDAIHFNNRLNKWLFQFDDDKREVFVNTVFNTIEKMKIEKLSDIIESKQKQLIIALNAVKNVDKEFRTVIYDTIVELISLYKSYKKKLEEFKKKNSNKKD